MTAEKAKRQLISDLLDAEMDKKVVAQTVGVSLTTVYKVVKSKKEGYGLDRKQGSGGNGLKRDTIFLKQLEARIKEDPTMSMRRLAIEFKVSEKTIHNVFHDNLGLNSFAQVSSTFLQCLLKKKD